MTEPNGTVGWRLSQLEKRVDDLDHTIDRLMFTVIGGCITLVISIVVYIVN